MFQVGVAYLGIPLFQRLVPKTSHSGSRKSQPLQGQLQRSTPTLIHSHHGPKFWADADLKDFAAIDGVHAVHAEVNQLMADLIHGVALQGLLLRGSLDPQ
jgi:hypothetical protein